MLTTAHGADAALLTAEELADELRLDEETLQLLFGVALLRRGFAGAGADVAALEEAGIDFVIGDSDEPCRVGERLLALPIVVCEADELETALRTARAGVEMGAKIVGADALAAELTPPWLRRSPLPPTELPAALTALAQLGQWCVSAFGLRHRAGRRGGGAGRGGLEARALSRACAGAAGAAARPGGVAARLVGRV